MDIIDQERTQGEPGPKKKMEIFIWAPLAQRIKKRNFFLVVIYIYIYIFIYLFLELHFQLPKSQTSSFLISLAQVATIKLKNLTKTKNKTSLLA